MTALGFYLCALLALTVVQIVAFLWRVTTARRASPQPPASYTCRSGATVEGDLDLDDGRPTDPGEELTVVSEPGWEEDTLVSASEKLRGAK